MRQIAKARGISPPEEEEVATEIASEESAAADAADAADASPKQAR